jgi:hypothetical protein
MRSKRFPVLTLFLLASVPLSGQNDRPYRGLVRDFVGVNTNVGAYDNRIVDDLARAAVWMREYHRWEFFEQEKDVYGWDDFTPAFNGGTWPFHTRFVNECAQYGVNLVICAERSTEWASANRDWNGPPYGDRDGRSETDYLDKAEFIAQLVARYGAVRSDASVLQTADGLTGLNVVHYYEDENEPDQTWWPPTWPGDRYAKYLNAVHDGYKCENAAGYPLIGIKTADPTAVHVLGGLTGDNLEYLDAILANTDGRIPFDVLNFHHYCTSLAAGTRGKSPEQATYGFEKIVANLVKWRDSNASGMPIWCTEFGWDTFKDPQNRNSWVYAPEASQANYILRSLFLLMGFGLEKAFVFFDTDPSSEDVMQFSSSGLLTDRNHGLEPKPSYYFLVTLQNRLGGFRFGRVEKYREGNPELYEYVLDDPTDTARECRVLWCRKPRSAEDDGTTAQNVRIQRSGILAASAVLPVDKSETGEEAILAVEDPGTAHSAVTLSAVSETPVFLFLETDGNSGVASPPGGTVGDLEMALYPNPTNAAALLEFRLGNRSHVRIGLFDVRGRRIAVLVDGTRDTGWHRMRLDFTLLGLPAGVYFIRIENRGRLDALKLCSLR